MDIAHASKWLVVGTSVLALAGLAACGGNSADTLTLTGTAATGAAIAARPIEAKCVSGSSSSITAADGRFSLDIAGGVLPCAVQVTLVDGSTLHGLASGVGKFAQVNVTPISELIVAQLTGSLPASYYASFGPASAALLNAGQLQAATSAVVDTLKLADVDFSAIGNPMSAPLVAASATAPGNSFDQTLDVLQAALKQGATSMQKLTESVAKASDVAPLTAPAGPQLPPNLLLKPQAPNCSALRSTTYRVIFQQPSGLGSDPQTFEVDVKAPTIVIKNPDGSKSRFTANGNCRFLTEEGLELVVSQAGVFVVRSNFYGVTRVGIGFPAQSHTLAQVKGDWKTVAYETDFSGPSPVHYVQAATGSFDKSGQLTVAYNCDALPTCLVAPPEHAHDLTLALNPTAGGFLLTNLAEGFAYRMFVYKAGGGEMMAVSQNGDCGLRFWSRRGPTTLPMVGDLFAQWDFGVDATWVAQFKESQATVVSAGTPVNGFVLSNEFNAGNGITRPETYLTNDPLPGYNRRVGGNTVASDGTTYFVKPHVTLGLQGMGVKVAMSPFDNSMNVAVVKP
jgi:hypothetical protein